MLIDVKEVCISTFLRGCNLLPLCYGNAKSFHRCSAKIKQFLQSRKYIYFCRQIYFVEKKSFIYYKPGIGW
jgi:hypothetical protein